MATVMPTEIILGVGGGVAAYKSAALASQLVQGGIAVTAVLTASGEKFLGAPTLAALTARPVARDMFDTAFPLGAHIELAERADLLCVAPATADLLAKFAHGIADDLLTTLFLCFQGPVLVAPAMNSAMWEKASTQRNLAQLQDDGVLTVGPDSGWLSCRQVGTGRMSDPESIVDSIAEALAAQSSGGQSSNES